jgi:hypothetical protein
LRGPARGQLPLLIVPDQAFRAEAEAVVGSNRHRDALELN